MCARGCDHLCFFHCLWYSNSRWTVSVGFGYLFGSGGNRVFRSALDASLSSTTYGLRFSTEIPSITQACVIVNIIVVTPDNPCLPFQFCFTSSAMVVM